MQSIANHLIRQNSPSSVAAFDDHHSDCAAEPQKQRPSSSSLRKIFQKVNGRSSSGKNQHQQQKQKQQSSAKVVDALSSAYSDAASASTASTSMSSSASVSSSSSMYSDVSAPLAPARAHDDECQRFFHDGDDESDEVDIQAGGPMEVDNDIITSSASSLVAPSKSCLSTSESKSAKNASKRSVHFDETVCIGRIPSLDTYTDYEINSLYYSAEEERILRTEAKAVVSALRMSRTTGQILDDDEYCSRGLENYLLPKEMKRRKRAEAKGVIHSVLMEQEDQYDNNYVDECALAIASLTRSRGARTDAMERAFRDEAEIAAKEDFVEKALTINSEVVRKADKAVSRRRSPPSGLISSLKASSRASCA